MVTHPPPVPLRLGNLTLPKRRVGHAEGDAMNNIDQFAVVVFPTRVHYLNVASLHLGFELLHYGR
jgi:hypothetical protein